MPKTPTLSSGLPDGFRLIANRLPDWRPEVIFDVGANVGQSALAYAAGFPAARIHSFEPVPRTYAKLVAATKTLETITPHPFALGRHAGDVVMTDLPASVLNHVVAAPIEGQAAVQGIRMRRGDELFSELKLRRISFLKIDTEGHDLEVLRGFGAKLAKVDFVQVEAGMNPYNKTHVPYDRLVQFLSKRGFLLFYILDQKQEFKKGGRAVLRRANPIFINGALVDLDGIS